MLKTILFINVGADMYGADYVLLCLVRSLDPAEFRSIILVPYAGPLVEELEQSGARVIVREFPVLRRSVFTPLGILRFAFQMAAGLLFTFRLARKEKVDIFHTNTASLWPPGIIARLLRRPHFWQVMELVEKPRLVSLVMSKLVGAFSTRVFCISDAVRRHFLSDNPGREAIFQTLYHGVDTSQYDPEKANGTLVRSSLGIPTESVVVLYAGRFSAWKGQEIFARAIPGILKQAECDIRFLMIGSCFHGQEHFADDLRDLLVSLKLEPGRVFVEGFQNNLPDWMAASDIFVLPSKRPEPNATVLIGAMSMGLPCIGTNIGGTAETIQDGATGILISPSDVAALQAAVLRLAKGSPLRRQMGAAGRARAMKVFSVENYCETIKRAYRGEF
jgi:glycosyltransferase involved in cell wall biosynthesis